MDENRMYTTVQGDMWDYIAWKFYGDEKYISLLFSGNPDLLEISVFSAGTNIGIQLPDHFPLRSFSVNFTVSAFPEALSVYWNPSV